MKKLSKKERKIIKKFAERYLDRSNDLVVASILIGYGMQQTTSFSRETVQNVNDMFDAIRRTMK